MTKAERSRMYYLRDREAILARQKERRLADPAAFAARTKACRLKNKDAYDAKGREWAAANPDKRREAVNRWHRKNRLTPAGRLNNRIRNSLSQCLRPGRKSTSKSQLLGWTLDELKTHIERQFLKGMSWENMSEWHIDHIVPLSSFKFESHEDPEFRRAWALTNLRPLWAGDNIRKHAKVLTLL